MALHRQLQGFTLVEVLIALSITAFVSMIAYSSLSSVISGVESMRESTDRTYEINRAWMIISLCMPWILPGITKLHFPDPGRNKLCFRIFVPYCLAE